MPPNNRDPETGGVADTSVDHPRDPPDSPNQPVSVPSKQSQPSQGDSIFGDSSGPLFSMYSKAAEEEDTKMADRWQKDADGVLIFTGLFSAAVAQLLSVSLQSLIPNGQDTSFYLRNIYGILADPNTTHPSTSPPVATPPTFSPPRYAIWVNSLWFLSLLISLTGALLATSSHQWARRYIRVTQPPRCSPEKRARMRAFFANGMEKMHIAQVVEGLPTLIHISLFLFFGGVAIFLFNINHAVFNSVIWWIALFAIAYGLITVMPIVRYDSPYYSPLSLPAWFLYAGMSYLSFKALFYFKAHRIYVFRTWQRLRTMRDRYRGWILGGWEEAAKENASERLSEIDLRILGWTIDALGDDDRLEKFFEVIPGFFNSKLVKHLKKGFPDNGNLLNKFWKASNGFFERTLLSNSVTEQVKSRRLDIGMKATSEISSRRISSIPRDLLFQNWDHVPQNVQIGNILTPWRNSSNADIAWYAHCIATRILASVQERDDSWIGLAADVLGSLKHNMHDLRNIAKGNDSVSLAILISVARRDLHSNFCDWGMLSTLSKLDIHSTPIGLQHDFCMLWNDSVREAHEKGYDSYPVGVLRETRLLFNALHQGTPAAPSASIDDFNDILFRPESYLPCDIISHRLDTSSVLLIPAKPSPRDRSSSGSAATASQGITPTGRISSTVLTSPLAPASASTVLNEPSAPTPSTSKFAHPTSSTTASPPLPNAELIALLSGTSLSNQLDNATLQRFRPRGLINKGNTCFANTVLQLLVNCPPFWNQFRDLGQLIGRRGHGNGQQAGGSMTVLVDATVRLLDEFVKTEKPSLTQQSLQPVEKGKAREGEKEKKEADDTDPFIPTYFYDAIKEKRQFKNMLDGRQQDAEEFFSVYLNALDEELLAVLTSVSTHKPASAALNVEGLREGLHSGEGKTEVGKRDDMVNSFKSPISRIFEGKFRTTAHMAGQPDTVTIEGWRSLQLDIQHDSIYTVQDAIARISQPQSVRVSPSGPSKASQPVTTVLIEALPPVLVLHLKRFLYDADTGGVVKIGKPVQFSPELEIPLDIMAPGAGRPALPARYKLNGVLYHHGWSARGGHYTVDVLHPNAYGGSGECWLHIDDESVRTVQHEDVFGRPNNERADDWCAYLLFYRHVGPT